MCLVRFCSYGHSACKQSFCEPRVFTSLSLTFPPKQTMLRRKALKQGAYDILAFEKVCSFNFSCKPPLESSSVKLILNWWGSLAAKKVIVKCSLWEWGKDFTVCSNRQNLCIDTFVDQKYTAYFYPIFYLLFRTSWWLLGKKQHYSLFLWSLTSNLPVRNTLERSDMLTRERKF